MKRLLALLAILSLASPAQATGYVYPPYPIPLPAVQGGTGQTSFTTNCLIAASSSTTLTCTLTPTISGANFTAGSIPNSALTTAPLTQNCTTWTPADISGASLAITKNGTQYYCKAGLQATAWFDITYPSNASGAGAAIGLPFTCQSVNFAGNITLNSLATGLGIIFNGTTMDFPSLQSAGGGGNANVTLSTGHFVGTGSCTTTS
jgi:hypothetical protein